MRFPTVVLTVVLTVALLFGNSAAQATTLEVFTSRALWEVGLTGLQTEDFESISPTGTLPPGTTQLGLIELTYSLTIPPPEETGGFPFPAVVEAGDVNGSHDLFIDIRSVAIGGDVTRPGPHVVSFPLPVTAFGADFSGTISGAILTLTVDDALVNFLDQLGSPGDGFLGVISDTPFSEVTFDVVLPLPSTPSSICSLLLPCDQTFSIDNVTFNPIPEPRSALLFAASALVVAAALRKKAVA